jgi:late competence protein required for DNA uptake (superfamily II DNA/RNA helicase)
VPSGGSVGASNTIHAAVTIAANTDYIYDGLEDIMEAGDTIRGLASVTSVVCVSISGDELL